MYRFDKIQQAALIYECVQNVLQTVLNRKTYYYAD